MNVIHKSLLTVALGGLAYGLHTAMPQGKPVDIPGGIHNALEAAGAAAKTAPQQAMQMVPFPAMGSDATIAYCRDNKVYLLTGEDKKSETVSTPKGDTRQVKVDDQKKVTALALDSKSTKLAVGFEDGKVEILDVKSLKKEAGLDGMKKEIKALAFQQGDNAAKLLGSDAEHTLLLWDTAKAGRTKPGITSQDGPDVSYFLCAGQKVFAIVNDQVKAYDISSNLLDWKLRDENFDQNEKVRGLMLSPDGKTLVGLYDTMTKVWDTEDPGKSIDPMTMFKDFVQHNLSDYSPQDLQGLLDKFVKKISKHGENTPDKVPSGQPIVLEQKHESAVNSLAFNPSGSGDNADNALVSAGQEGGVILWQPVDGDISKIKKATKYIRTRPKTKNDMAYLHEGSIVRSVAFSSDGKKMASGGEDKKIYVFNYDTTGAHSGTGFESKENTLPIETDNLVLSVAFLPQQNDRYLVSGGTEKALHVWDTNKKTDDPRNNGRIQGRQINDGATTDAISSLAVSSSGTYLAAGCFDGYVYLWKVSADEEKIKLTRCDTRADAVVHGLKKVLAVVIIADEYLVCGGTGSNGKSDIQVWKIEEDNLTYLPRAQMKAHNKSVRALAYQRQSHLLASSGTDDKIILWDMEHPEEPKQIGPSGQVDGAGKEKTGLVFSLAFSADGKWLASGSGPVSGKGSADIRLWDVEKLKKTAKAAKEKKKEQPAAALPDTLHVDLLHDVVEGVSRGVLDAEERVKEYVKQKR